MTTTIAPRFESLAAHGAARPRRSYANAHWYFLALFAVILAGFWPTFVRPMGAGGSPWRDVHGVTASLWFVGLIAQSWLMSRGHVLWHRRVARAMVLAVLPMLCLSAVVAIWLLLSGPVRGGPGAIPARLRPQVALSDFVLIAELIALVALGLRNRHTPPAHQRYMAATALVGLGPGLGRLYRNLFGWMPFGLLGPARITVEMLLVVLIAVDWRMGERRRWAYPLLLAMTLVATVTTPLLASTGWWLAFCRWFGAR